MKSSILYILFLLFFSIKPTMAAVNFMEDNPQLKQFLYKPPPTFIYFGYGISPLSVMKNKIYFTANLFQVHWIKSMWDIELFSVSYGKTLTKESQSSSSHFTFRTTPKIKIFKNFSLGPIIGLEVVRFEGINVQLYKDGLVSPMESFTSVGPIYGVMFSQLFTLKNKTIVKINEIFYNQTYSVTKTDNGWEYLYEDEALRKADGKDDIAPGLVFMLEANFLF